MKEQVYPYAVARIRVLEKYLLEERKLVQMAEASEMEDLLRIAGEAGYHGEDWETSLNKRRDETYQLIKELVPETEFTNFFLCQIDFHNAKVLLKQELSGSPGEAYLISGGLIQIATLKAFLKEDKGVDLPKHLAQGIREARMLAAKMQSGKQIDKVLDQAVYLQMEEYAQASSQFLQYYFQKKADLTNIQSFYRLRKRESVLEESDFVPGGTIPFATFFAAKDKELSGVRFSPYDAVCEKGFPRGITDLEKRCDDYLMQFVKQAKYEPLTIEPLIAYLYAVESEIKNLRMVITGKRNGISADTLKERLRMSYV